jgi:hypothetical protein
MGEQPKTPITFRPPDITKAQLKDLSEKWGENQSRVIVRCIDRVWCSVIQAQKEDEQKERSK